MNKKSHLFVVTFACAVFSCIKAASQVGSLELQLVAAVKSGCATDVRCLLHLGADVNCQDSQWQYSAPLHIAVEKGHKEIVKILLRAGANIDCPNVLGETPLYLAGESVRKDIVHILLDAGANVNTHDDEGTSPLHWAAGADLTELTQLLLDAGASTEAVDQSGDTPLTSAAETICIDPARLLLEAGADVNWRNNEGKTPLNCAIAGNCDREERNNADREAIVRLLLNEGAGASDRCNGDCTPLLYASEFGYEPIIQMLLERGAHWPEESEPLIEKNRGLFDIRGEALAVFFKKLDHRYNVHGDPARLLGLFADLPEEHTPKGSGGNNRFKRLLKRRRIE